MRRKAKKLEPALHPCAVCGKEIESFSAVCDDKVCRGTSYRQRARLKVEVRLAQGRCRDCDSPSETPRCRPCWSKRYRRNLKRNRAKRAKERAEREAARVLLRQIERDEIQMERLKLGLPVSRAFNPTIPQDIIPTEDV